MYIVLKKLNLCYVQHKFYFIANHTSLSNIFTLHVIFRPLDIGWEDEHFEIKGWKMISPIDEQLRPHRLVRVGLIQHSIVKGTMESVQDQRDAIHNKVKAYIVQAAQYQVNIVCLQEAWST